MARGVNRVILMGNLGADPEVRYTPDGAVSVTRFRVATSDVWKDRQTGERQERTEWHRVVLFNRLAEIAGKYLHKGSRVYVEGSLKTSKWQDPATNTDRYSTEIVASDLQFLDAKSAGAGAGFEGQEMPSAAPTRGGESEKAAMAEVPFDDDIPF